MVHRDTVETYEQRWADYERTRPPTHTARAQALAARARVDGTSHVVADVGCGPGGCLAALGAPVVGIDVAAAMLRRCRDVVPGALLVQADLEALPFRFGALGGGWARNAYVHLPSHDLPMALNELHRALAVNAPVEVSFVDGDGAEGIYPDAEVGDRYFATWPAARLADVFAGAGFTVDAIEPGQPTFVRARRARTLADTAGRGMRLLVCGLNPSVVSADVGSAFSGPSNRFWKAAIAAGAVTRARDPRHALADHGVGMTDLVKRATPRSSELGRAEYRAGAERVDRLVRWLAPAAVCFVGLEGWRAAFDRHASAGWQPAGIGGRPAYVMPSTSGLNASSSLDDLAGHLRAALLGPP